jgi:DNA-binding transcriptional regulator YhcF (GntR family)
VLDAKAIGEAVDRTYHDLPPVGDLAQRVYAAVARYAFDEAEAWPSQDRIAGELGLCRETVTRAVGRLIRAGWLIVKERRWSWRSDWLHNVYELLAPFCVSEMAARTITRRAHNTRRKRLARARARGLSTNPFGDDHTNPKGCSDRCSCRSCRPDRKPEMSLRRPPRPLDARERRRQEWADQDWKAAEVIRRCRLDQRSPSLQQAMSQTTSERRDCAHGAIERNIPSAPQVCNRP